MRSRTYRERSFRTRVACCIYGGRRLNPSPPTPKKAAVNEESRSSRVCTYASYDTHARTHACTHPRSHKPTPCRAYTDLTLCRARSARISHPSGSFILLGHVHHFPPLSSAGSLTTALFHFVPYRMHALSSLSSRAYFPLIPSNTLHPSRSLFLSLTTLYALPHSSFLRPVTYPLARNFFLSFTLSLTRSFPVLLVLVYSFTS